VDQKTDIDPKVPIETLRSGVGDPPRSVRQADQHLALRRRPAGIVETNLDSLPDIYFGATALAGLNNGWLPTVPGKGRWISLLYNLLRPKLDRACRPSEIQPI
jgi:hypothetical protein